MTTLRKIICASVALAAFMAYLPASDVYAKIEGHTSASTTPVFNLTAKEGRLSTGDANSVLFWGFADDDGQDNSKSIKGGVQYPGPTLIVNEGATVTINLTNNLAEPVSMIFLGLDVLTSTVPVFQQGDKTKLSSLTPEAPPAGKQVYKFVATRPGTFYYQSGSNQDIQIRMGLFGVIIVRPTSTASKTYTNVYPNHETTDRTFTKFAYNESGVPDQIPTLTNVGTMSNVSASTGYDREFLYLGSEMDPDFQLWMDLAADRTKRVSYADWKDANLRKDFTQWKANYWFANGRNAPDDMTEDYNPNLLTQPYSCQPLMHPGESILMRFGDLGRDFHPLHTHAQHQRIIAKDGLIQSSSALAPGDANYASQAAATGADLSTEEFTLTLSSGNTIDSIFTWTGKGIGWDVYGHNPGDPPAPYEYLPDHVTISAATTTGPAFSLYGRYDNNQFAPLLGSGNPGPLQAGPTNFSPDQLSYTFGPWFSGSPFLGGALPLPPSDVSFNLGGSGIYFMWHSHAEREITNNNIFPGGMLSMMGIIPWTTKIAPAEMPYD